MTQNEMKSDGTTRSYCNAGFWRVIWRAPTYFVLSAALWTHRPPCISSYGKGTNSEYNFPGTFYIQIESKSIRVLIKRLLIRFFKKFFAIFTCHIFRNFATVWIKGGIFDIFGRGIRPCCDHYFRWEAAFFRFRKSKVKITEKKN